MAETAEEKSAYGKRPLWQWILVYLVIAAVLYGAFYYFVLAKKGGYNQPAQYQTQQTSSPAVSPQSSSAPSNNVYMIKTNASKGDYLTDLKGITLYIFDKDKPGVSNCYNSCAAAWPPYTSGATAQSNLPANISVVKRTDGTNQFAYKSSPLYYYATDAKAGDITGDGVGGVWHIVKP
ncbi:MAG: hypothetical protein M1444_03590 [Patescibacteria group bacterium]|nr:hypothetical protein [Patescibacteria group bacterium]